MEELFTTNEPGLLVSLSPSQLPSQIGWVTLHQLSHEKAFKMEEWEVTRSYLLDPTIFSGSVVVSKDPASHLLIFIHQHWVDSVTETKTSLSCHDYFPSFTLLIIQRMSMSV
jgi:hypothetical protein